MDDQIRQSDQSQQFGSEPEETFTRPADTAMSSPPTQEPMQVKKKSGAKKWLLWGLVLVLLAAAGAFSYLQWSDAHNLNQELEATKQQLKVAQDANKENAATKEDDSTPASTGDTVKVRADKMALAIKAAHKNSEYVAKVGTVKGDFVEIIVGMPSKDGTSLVFKNTTESLVQIASYEAMAGMTKAEADTLKVDYGFDAAAFGVKVNS